MAHPTVGVLVGAATPRMLRVTEVHSHAGMSAQLLVYRHVGAGQRRQNHYPGLVTHQAESMTSALPTADERQSIAQPEHSVQRPWSGSLPISSSSATPSHPRNISWR